MRDLAHLKDLLAHCAWADGVFFHAWAKAETGDTELRERLAHCTGTQDFFLKTLRGEMDLPWDKILKGEVRPPWLDQPLPSFEGLRDWTRSNHTQLKACVEGLDEARSQALVKIPWFPDPPCVVSMAEALVQVAMHTQHHRGQAMTRLKAIGGKPVNVDYLIWLWKGRPEARWD